MLHKKLDWESRLQTSETTCFNTNSLKSKQGNYFHTIPLELILLAMFPCKYTAIAILSLFERSNSYWFQNT